MNRITVKIKSKNPLPQYKTKGAAGFDLESSEYVRLQPGQTRLVDCGIEGVEIPEGYELQIRSRSGMALNEGLIVLNAPGTVDSDYRGPVKIILHNTGSKEIYIEPGTRIAQGVLSMVFQANWEKAEELSFTERGDGGFGSTGVK